MSCSKSYVPDIPYVKDIPYRGVLCTSECQFEYYKFISKDYENKAICFNLIQCWTKMLQLQSMIRKLLVAITIKTALLNGDVTSYTSKEGTLLN